MAPSPHSGCASSRTQLLLEKSQGRGGHWDGVLGWVGAGGSKPNGEIPKAGPRAGRGDTAVIASLQGFQGTVPRAERGAMSVSVEG